MTYYKLRKAKLAEEAKEWQIQQSQNNFSWGEVAEKTTYFYKQAKKYGLVKEFKENGIL